MITTQHEPLTRSVPAYGLNSPAIATADDERAWFAVFTLPQNERSVRRRLDVLAIESFLPTFELTRVWKNRQKTTVDAPLFPTYLFVHISRVERWRVVESPGVVSIVGNSRGPIPLSNAEIEFLRSDFCRSRIAPFPEIAVGQRVRIKCGPMGGVTGTLVRRKGLLRFVLNVQLINLQASVEVDAQDIEPIPA